MGLIIGIIFGAILGAVASYGYVTSLASGLTSITHITQDVNKLVSYSYDSNRWDKDSEKLTLLSNSNCKIYPGVQEVNLLDLKKSEEKLKVYGDYEAVGVSYIDEFQLPKKKVVTFDITPNFSKTKNVAGKVKYIFLMELETSTTDSAQRNTLFSTCDAGFEKILNTFTIKDVKK